MTLEQIVQINAQSVLPPCGMQPYSPPNHAVEYCGGYACIGAKQCDYKLTVKGVQRCTYEDD